jgi:hypothetical protein
MNTRLLLVLSCVAPLWLAGCGGDDDGDGGGSAFLDIFNRDANSEPVAIGDADSLRGDIEALFGGSDSESKGPEDVL